MSVLIVSASAARAAVIDSQNSAVTARVFGVFGVIGIFGVNECGLHSLILVYFCSGIAVRGFREWKRHYVRRQTKRRRTSVSTMVRETYIYLCDLLALPMGNAYSVNAQCLRSNILSIDVFLSYWLIYYLVCL